MRKILFAGMAIVLASVLSSCGGNLVFSTGTFIAQTFSDIRADGDVSFDPVTSTFTVSHASSTGNVIFGINDAAPGSNSVEFRAFLDFPLDGSNSGDAVPAGATIVSADIEVFVGRVDFATTVPTLLDLITYDPVTGPVAGDFTNPTPLAFRSLDFLATDAGNLVRIDVTSLMREAQRLGLRNFQLRFLLDLVPGAAGLVTISDSESSTAPLLTVEYF
ncbi:MAG: hypothetical protein HY896_13030 [Deltaproteobacteria bacterium]|nr:hypothetical protein [Deltaproteobacteria bacterium]